MASITVVAASRGGQQQPVPHPDTLSPQQLREWVIQRGRPGGRGYRAGGAGGAGQQWQPAHLDTLSPQQIREWIVHVIVTMGLNVPETKDRVHRRISTQRLQTLIAFRSKLQITLLKLDL
ncbi:unnamed protein product [Closterium sp. NIES-54]